MPAYLIVDIDVHDPVRYEEYKQLAAPTVAACGGKVETLEGGWSPKRSVALEFENVDRAKARLNSLEYRDARKIRYVTATPKMIVVEGVPV